MNPVVKVESDDNFQEFNYLKDEKGSLDDYSKFYSDNLDHIVSQFTLEEIKETIRNLEADLSLPTQGSSEPSSTDMIDKAPTHDQPQHQKYLADATKPIYSMTTTHEPQHQRLLADVTKPIYSTTTTHEHEYLHHDMNNVVDAKPMYSTIMSTFREVVPKGMISKSSNSSFSDDQDTLVNDEMAMYEIKSESNKCLIHDLCGDDYGNEKRDVVVVESDNVMKKKMGRSKTCALEVDEIRKYFELPITQAAKELNVGQTVLKKRCRELNIMRWPHRKIKSLNCLIHNVKEMGIRNENELEMLEENKRMLEIEPELELSERTKRLRQSFFKANYKKRRLHLASFKE